MQPPRTLEPPNKDRGTYKHALISTLEQPPPKKNTQTLHGTAIYAHIDPLAPPLAVSRHPWQSHGLHGTGSTCQTRQPPRTRSTLTSPPATPNKGVSGTSAKAPGSEEPWPSPELAQAQALLRLVPLATEPQEHEKLSPSFGIGVYTRTGKRQ